MWKTDSQKIFSCMGKKKMQLRGLKTCLSWNTNFRLDILTEYQHFIMSKLTKNNEEGEEEDEEEGEEKDEEKREKKECDD